MRQFATRIRGPQIRCISRSPVSVPHVTARRVGVRRRSLTTSISASIGTTRRGATPTTRPRTSRNIPATSATSTPRSGSRPSISKKVSATLSSARAATTVAMPKNRSARVAKVEGKAASVAKKKRIGTDVGLVSATREESIHGYCSEITIRNSTAADLSSFHCHQLVERRSQQEVFVDWPVVSQGGRFGRKGDE